MKPAMDFAKLDDLLSRWHWWQINGNVGRGFNRRSLVAGEYISGGHYDAANGAQDQAIDSSTAAAIDAQVGELAEPQRAAIYALARNLCLGLDEWTSPRLPVAQAERAAIVHEARAFLAARLAAAGVL